jgi:oligopeptidase A
MKPLLQGQGLPPFPEIKPDQVVPDITELLSQANEALKQIEASLVPTWAGLVEPLDRLVEPLSWAWGIVGHLMGVQNSPELRAAHEVMQPQIVQFWMQLGQSQALYEGYKALKASPEFATFDGAQQRIVDAAIRDMELSGVGLTGDPKQRFNEIQIALAEIANKFVTTQAKAKQAFP